jgi:hypothetical protein
MQMKMTPVGILWLAGGLFLGCHGSSSPTETKSAPTISNLTNPAKATALGGPLIDGQRPGLLPITFNFTDQSADLDGYVLTLPNGVVKNGLQGLKGETSGSSGVQQSLLLPASGTKVTYTFQVSDQQGNTSNTLTGTFVAP